MNTTETSVLRARADAGDVRALATLGKRLLLGQGVAANPAAGSELLAQAAARGVGEASAQLARLAAWGVLRPQDWPTALSHLQQSAERGWAPAQRELQCLARRTGTDWAALREAVDLAAWRQVPRAQVLRTSPAIRVVAGFATAAECSWLVSLAGPSLRRAQVYNRDAAGFIEGESRTNSEADYTFENADLVLRLLTERIATATDISPRLFEVAKLLHYLPGQQFAPHCDFQEPSTPALAREVQLRGQRVATVLVYLNDDYEGGETDFPRAGLRYKATVGDALMFASVRPSGELDYDSIHAGLPPTRGEKWVLSQWIRERPVAGRP